MKEAEGRWLVQEQRSRGRASAHGVDVAAWTRVCTMDEGAGGWDRTPGGRKSARSGGRWCVVLLSEVQQWLGCSIQRPANMEAGFGDGEQ